MQIGAQHIDYYDSINFKLVPLSLEVCLKYLGTILFTKFSSIS